MFLPRLVRQVELVHSYEDAVYIYYDDGRMAQFLDLYVDAGIDALMTLTPPPMGDVVPEDAKSRFGDRVCLVGGVDAVKEIHLSNPKDIRDTVRRRLDILRPGGAYIMDGSNSLVWETPAENVRAFVDAGVEFGGY
jgi:uroporphyrinogen decarboxylase